MKTRGYALSLNPFVILILSIALSANMRAQTHPDSNAVPVKILVDRELTSATATVGQEVPMHVSEAVVKDGKEVIASGAQVRAHITRVKPPGHGARDGQIKLTIVSVQSIGGSWVPMHKGAVRRGNRMVALFAGPCSVPFPLTMLMVGEDVRIPKGQLLTAYARSGDLH